MLNKPDDVMAALRGTVLDGQPVTTVPESDVLLVDWPTPEDLLSAWQAARTAMPVTGRRPLFIDNDFQEWPFPQIAPDHLARIDAAARTLDPWSTEALQSWRDDEPVDADGLNEAIEDAMGDDEDGRLLSAVPGLAAEMAKNVPLPTTTSAVQKWVFDRVADNPDLTAKLLGPSGVGEPSAYLDWFVPERVQLALLPTTSAWLPMVWHGYFGLEDDEIMAACLWQWNQAWGAELVASWYTMLQFVVGHRPAFGPAAWALAGQQLALGHNLEIPQFDLAWDLSLRDTWFLHSRP